MTIHHSPLKILYLFTSPSLRGSSVQTKVLNQIKYLNKAGAECRGAFFSTEVTEITPLNEQVDLLPVEKCSWKYFKASGQKRNSMLSVLNYAEKHYSGIDYFYFRYPGAGSLLQKFTQKYGNKTIFEHLSIEELEIKLHAKENPFGIKPSRLFSWFEYTTLPIWREQLFGKTIRKNAKLGICNSHDIALWQKTKSGGTYKIIIGGDAVNTESYRVKKLAYFTDTLHLIFLKGASTDAEYNGIDRVMKGIKNYSGELKVCIHILGRNTNYEKRLQNEMGLNPNSVNFPGFMSGVELDNYIDQMHLGIGQFGIHRKGLHSNSTIKSREYVARALPFIYGHHDPDFNDNTKNFAFCFPSNDEAIDIQKVINFTQKTLSDATLPQKMRKYAKEYLDYKVKMKKLFNLLKETRVE